MTEHPDRPADAADLSMLSDADGNTLMLVIPDDIDSEIGVGVIDGETLDFANPLSTIALWPDQAITLGEALVRAGIRKQVLLEGQQPAVRDRPARPVRK
jgi:hypothetical protein